MSCARATLAASMAVYKFLGVYGDMFHFRSQVELVNEFTINYDPLTGRFTTRDTVFGDLTDARAKS